MRIRKEVSNLNWLRIIKYFFAIFLVVNGALALIKFFMFDATDVQWLWIMQGGILPIILASSFAVNQRQLTLFIHEYHHIPEFHEKLLQHAQKKGLVIDQQYPESTTLKPISRFYNLFKSWKGHELVHISNGDTITIKGPLYRVTQLEDTLTWNKDFNIVYTSRLPN